MFDMNCAVLTDCLRTLESKKNYILGRLCAYGRENTENLHFGSLCIMAV